MVISMENDRSLKHLKICRLWKGMVIDNMHGRRTDNRGFSLIEVVIVVAIMSVMIATISYGLSFSSGKPAEQAAQELTSQLQHARTSTMGKFRVDITIRKDSADGTTVFESRTYNDQNAFNTGAGIVRDSVVAADGVRVEYSVDGTNYTELGSGASISIGFSRSTGALKPDPSGNYICYFRFSRANTTRVVSIVPLTGRIAITD